MSKKSAKINLGDKLKCFPEVPKEDLKALSESTKHCVESLKAFKKAAERAGIIIDDGGVID